MIDPIRWTEMIANPGPLPEAFEKLVNEWLRINNKKPSEVRWGLFPLGMVQTWIDRASLQKPSY